MSSRHPAHPSPLAGRRRLGARAFALVVVLGLMVLLTLLAVGLLTLSSVALRSSTQDEAMGNARANARLAVMLALNELQKAAGDDRRITADGSLIDDAEHPYAVGIWKSWSPKLADNPTASKPDYTNKSQQFVTWLASGCDSRDLASPAWGKTGILAKPVDLFTEKSDGFRHSGSSVEVAIGAPYMGALAWAIVQDATKAKISVGGPEPAQRLANVDLHVQPRPSVAKSDSFRQPTADWNQRASRVLSMGQAQLDGALWKGLPVIPEGADFTANGFGLLTDVVNGGLKTDLSLGFEMSDADFLKDRWGDFKNPFRAVNFPNVTTPPNYKGERPLFKPLTESGSVRVDLNFPPANTVYEFPAAVVPTFTTLRSFYRTPYHLYSTADGPTVFERGMDHVALKQPVPNDGQYVSPCATPPAQKSQTSYRPVLDRMLFVLSMGLSAESATQNEIRLILTPIVTLWNPYNVAMEIEGSVLYQWMDAAHYPNWTFYQDGNQTGTANLHMAALLTKQFVAVGHGRSVNPYFFFSITPDGTGTAVAGKSIRFQPGEVRVFAPASPVAKELLIAESIRNRTLYLRPVESVDQLSLRGGFAIPMRNAVFNYGITRVLAPTESVQINFSANGIYPFGIGLEDATRAKLTDPGDFDRGQAVTDVQTADFIDSGATATLTSSQMSFAEVSNPAIRQPFGMFETYHRVASDAAAYRKSDLVYTTNPRQAHVNRFLTKGTFYAAPHYETRMTQLSSFNQVIQTANAGRNAYYGATNSSGSGVTHLAFFEVPRAPLLSLAALQHADFAGTSYSTANQFANSWASAYLKRDKVADKSLTATLGIVGAAATYTRAEMPVYDYSYLANEALWDSFFFSGAAPKLQPGTITGSPAVWNTDIAAVNQDLKTTLQKFIDDPSNNPLRNPRMRFHSGNVTADTLKRDLLSPQGCLQIAAHLQVDGAFNINSTSEKAWTAFLSGMRDVSFDITGDPRAAAKAVNQSATKGNTPYPRFRNPVGTENNRWLGFRSLTDAQVADLATKIVLQIKKRGPFLSLGEFVNRRIDTSTLGLKGTIQTAIDDTAVNQAALYDTFDTAGYPATSRPNIVPNNTGVGIPGYLTQADVLQSIAPVLTVRSDTFTIRGYGETKDASGKVLAKAWCEAVVQRIPEFVDAGNPAHTAIANLNPTNRLFGRRFSIMSFRYLVPSEVGL
ncbi:MAG: hypothetical protein NTW21_34785 [Verrucomicrobia bacterium]|nr:hypothetical protein [Verrucomicrobiota bacterium]